MAASAIENSFASSIYISGKELHEEKDGWLKGENGGENYEGIFAGLEGNGKIELPGAKNGDEREESDEHEEQGKETYQSQIPYLGKPAM